MLWKHPVYLNKCFFYIYIPTQKSQSIHYDFRQTELPTIIFLQYVCAHFQLVTFEQSFSLHNPFPRAIDYWKVLEHWKFPSDMPTIIWMMTDHKTARHSRYISQSMCLCTSFYISICSSLFFPTLSRVRSLFRLLSVPLH